MTMAFRRSAKLKLLQLIVIDWFLLTNLITLVLVGLLILYSASNQSTLLLIKQLLHIGLSLLVLLIFSQIPVEFWKRSAGYIYGAGLLLLMAVLLMGHSAKGAERWLTIIGFRFQPSELMKLALPIMLANYFSNCRSLPNVTDIAIGFIIIFIPAILVFKQPDLGTSILLILSGFSMLLFVGISWRMVLVILLALLVFMPFLWHGMHNYQQQRLLTFLNPMRDPRGAGYHIIQSKIAIGSGGLFGQGWLKGSQSYLHFIPEHTTDFIFAVSSEEFGFLGCLFLLLIYITVSMRGFYIACQSEDMFAKFLAASLSFMFFLSAYINMAMVSGMLPVVGVPLPLVSYSGTEMITLFASFGILISAHHHKKLF